MDKYDFYFSKTSCRLRILRGDSQPLFSGKPYTEAIKSGRHPLTSFYKDLVKIGEGTMKDVTIK